MECRELQITFDIWRSDSDGLDSVKCKDCECYVLAVQYMRIDFSGTRELTT